MAHVAKPKRPQAYYCFPLHVSARCLRSASGFVTVFSQEQSKGDDLKTPPITAFPQRYLFIIIITHHHKTGAEDGTNGQGECEKGQTRRCEVTSSGGVSVYLCV